MKIAISGSHSTGKTTFLDALREAVKPTELPTVAKLAPEARDHGFPILKNHTFESTLWLIVAGIKRELEFGLKHPVVLVDRPVMEAYAYLNAALRDRGQEITPEQRSYLEGLARLHAPTYDVVIKTVVDPTQPIASRIEKRDHDEKFRDLVDREIDTLYVRLNLRVILLPRGDKQVLADMIARVKKELLAKG